MNEWIFIGFNSMHQVFVQNKRDQQDMLRCYQHYNYNYSNDEIWQTLSDTNPFFIQSLILTSQMSNWSFDHLNDDAIIYCMLLNRTILQTKNDCDSFDQIKNIQWKMINLHLVHHYWRQKTINDLFHLERIDNFFSLFKSFELIEPVASRMVTSMLISRKNITKFSKLIQIIYE